MRRFHSIYDMKYDKKNNRIFLISMLFFVAYFGFWWLFKLDTLPGLHGDEAWFGLEGASYRKNGIHLFLYDYQETDIKEGDDLFPHPVQQEILEVFDGFANCVYP